MSPINSSTNNPNGRFYSVSHQSFVQILSHFDIKAAVLANSFKSSSDLLSMNSLQFTFLSNLTIGGATLQNLCKPQQASDGHLILHFNNVSRAQRALSVLTTSIPSCNFRQTADVLHLSLPLLTASRRRLLRSQLTITLRSTIQTLKHTRENSLRRMRLVSFPSQDARLTALNNLESLSSAASSLIAALYAAAASRLRLN
ncbi:MAG: hypothetical protein ACTS4U_01655 [Candidatus Hodgkinia cicadicola]